MCLMMKTHYCSSLEVADERKVVSVLWTSICVLRVRQNCLKLLRHRKAVWKAFRVPWVVVSRVSTRSVAPDPIRMAIYFHIQPCAGLRLAFESFIHPANVVRAIFHIPAIQRPPNVKISSLTDQFSHQIAPKKVHRRASPNGNQ